MIRKVIRTMTLAVVLFCGLLLPEQANAQMVGVKTNLLYGATLTPNLGVEVALSKKMTLELFGTYHPWEILKDNAKIKHYMIQPELRFWNCEKFNRGFWGVNLTYAYYNVGGIKLPLNFYPNWENYRYEGWVAGIGVNYGYQWYLSPHWNLEANLGVGFLHFDYDRYKPETCGIQVGSGTKNYIGITKVGVSFVYLFKSKK